MEVKTVLRVGVYNNFNFTDREITELKQYEDKYLPFVNSNSFVTIKADYPSIVTINPYLTSWQPPEGDLTNLKACRVKWVEGATDVVHTAQMESIDWCLSHSIPVLITFMRFASKQSLKQFVVESCTHKYNFAKSYYRLSVASCADVLSRLVDYANSRGQLAGLIYACDLQGQGCPACGNCARLSYGKDCEVHALSLSCSGDGGACIFHCPDCWAKRMSKFATFKYDSVTKNNKQKGKTSHE